MGITRDRCRTHWGHLQIETVRLSPLPRRHAPRGRKRRTPGSGKTIGSRPVGPIQRQRASAPCRILITRPLRGGSKAARPITPICPVSLPGEAFRTSVPSSSRRPEYRAPARRRRQCQERLLNGPGSATRTSTIGTSAQKGTAHCGWSGPSQASRFHCAAEDANRATDSSCDVYHHGARHPSVRIGHRARLHSPLFRWSSWRSQSDDGCTHRVSQPGVGRAPTGARRRRMTGLSMALSECDLAQDGFEASERGQILGGAARDEPRAVVVATDGDRKGADGESREPFEEGK